MEKCQFCDKDCNDDQNIIWCLRCLSCGKIVCHRHCFISYSTPRQRNALDEGLDPDPPLCCPRMLPTGSMCNSDIVQVVYC